MLRWPDRWSNDLRTGATFVHDWFAIGVTLAVIGHIVFALRDPVALRRHVARHGSRRAGPDAHIRRWYEEETGLPADRLAHDPGSRAGSPR